MREIKFRVWDKVGCQMLLFNFTHDKTLEVHASRLQVAWFSDAIQREDPIEQFTGLHDRNGVEIYEGDVVRFCRKQGYWSHDRGDIESVKYITDQQAQYCGFGFSALHPLTRNKAQKIEVIGNIHENPELAGKKEA